MAMSSVKSSSMAAVLLVVAVVAGTCASGAQANFNITNSCNNSNVSIFVKGTPPWVVLAPGQSHDLNVPPNTFLQPLVGFYFNDTSTHFNHVRIPKSELDELKKLGVELQKIEIRYKGDCIMLYVTSKPLQNATVTNSQGPFCPTAPAPRH